MVLSANIQKWIFDDKKNRTITGYVSGGKKMPSIERKDVMNMVAMMCAGIFANPASGTQDQYSRQQVIQQTIWDTQSAIQGAGLTIIEPDET